MKASVGIVAFLIATSAFAQTAPPKVGAKPLVQVKPVTPMGCKLVGTVKGIKIWAGDCTGSGEIRGAVAAPPTAPATALPDPPVDAIPGQRQ